MKIIKSLMMAMLLVVALPMCADRDKVIAFEQLPASAQGFLKKNFPGKTPLLVTTDYDGLQKSFDVSYSDGTSVEFDAKGNWTDVECPRTGCVPKAVVPSGIKNFVAKNYPQEKIVKIDRDRLGYDVNPSNGLELEFTRHQKLKKIDN